jgi:DNA-binding MarR family transcriptional regulator
MAPVIFERLSQLEVLLLVLVKAGIATPYDLLNQIGIGVGTTSPALKRMATSGLLTVIPGPRNRMRFSITEEGDKRLRGALDSGPPRYWRHGERDTFDSLRRVVLLAWVDNYLSGADYCVHQAGIELEDLLERRIRRAAQLREKVHRTQEDKQKEGQPLDDADLIAYVSGWIEAVFDASQFELQIKALPRIRDLMADLPNPPDLWPKPAQSAGSGQKRPSKINRSLKNEV